MSDTSPVSDSAHAGKKMAFYTTFAGGKNLIALGGYGYCPREVVVLDGAGGTFEFVDPEGTTHSVAADLIEGIPLAGVATITANTTATSVMVTW
jgi:hypothetical protein